MQIPMLLGREIDERDGQGACRSWSSATVRQNFFGDGTRSGVTSRSAAVRPVDLEIVGVAASVRYGGLKHDIPPVVYVRTRR